MLRMVESMNPMSDSTAPDDHLNMDAVLPEDRVSFLGASIAYAR